MAYPSPAISEPLPTAGWRLPALGMLLACLGVGMIAASVGQSGFSPPSPRPATGAANFTVVREATTDGVTVAVPMSTAGNLPWGRAAPSPEEMRVAPGRSHTPSACLGSDLATGWRAESAHLATAPLPRSADCGDARDAIKGLAALPYGEPPDDMVPQPAGVVAASPRGDDVDVMAAALYGPPDRKPQATLEDELLHGGRGWVRGYLEIPSRGQR